MIFLFPGPDQHIRGLYNKWESAIREKEKLTAAIADLGKEHMAELETRIRLLSEEWEHKRQDAVERAKLEGR